MKKALFLAVLTLCLFALLIWCLFRTTEIKQGSTSICRIVRSWGRVTRVESITKEKGMDQIWFFAWRFPFESDPMNGDERNFYGLEIWKDTDGDGKWNFIIKNTGGNTGTQGVFQVFAPTGQGINLNLVFSTNHWDEKAMDRVRFRF